MPAVALAFSNNDVAVVAWAFDKHLHGCLGFAVIRIDSSGKETTLPAMATFDGKPPGCQGRRQSSTPPAYLAGVPKKREYSRAATTRKGSP